MFALAGLLVVIVSVVFGYLASHGNLLALWQPFEIVIICGAALGAFMVANPIYCADKSVNYVAPSYFWVVGTIRSFICSC